MIATTHTWLVRAPVLCALIPLTCVTAAEWLAVAPYGSETFLWLVLLFVFPALAAIPASLIALLGLAFHRTKRLALVVGLCSVAYLIGFIASVWIGERVRMNAFHRLAERSRPLINAIHAFEQKHGRPPESLQAMVPEFLPTVPSTGMRAYPAYRYSMPATNYHGNPWVLVVFTPSGGINFDTFMYFPLTNYPKTGYGGWLEPVGDWAYVHE